MPVPCRPRAIARGALLLAAPLALAAAGGCVSGGPNTVPTSSATSSVTSSATVSATSGGTPAGRPSVAPSDASPTRARVTLPDLRGVNAAMAGDQLARRGLKKITYASAEPGTRFVIQSADWHVTRQSVAPGGTVAAGSALTLDVRRGVGTGGSGPPSGSATMPDVVGKDGAAALAALRAVGCWKAVLAPADRRHRAVLNPSGWRVTAQLLGAGRRFDPHAVVVLAVRKPG